MTAAPAPRWAGAGVLLALSLLLPVPAAVGSAPVQEGPLGERSMTLAARSPWVAPGEALRLDVDIEGAVGQLLAQLRVHAPVDSIEDLEDSLEEDTGPVLYRSPDIPLGFVPVQADGTRRFEVGVSDTASDDFTALLREPGVYPVTLALVGEDGVAEQVVRTPVVRLGTPEEPLVAPDLALVVDVAAPPSIEADGRRDLAEDELDRLERLAAVIEAGAADGAAGEPLGMTLAPSPDTVDALTASADPRASRVLDALALAPGGRTVLGGPYVPIDVSALGAAGLGDFVDPIVTTGRAVLDDRVGPPIVRTLWEVAGGMDPAGAGLLADLGVEHVLVDAAEPDAAGSPAAERSLVDAGPVEVPGIEPLDAVLVDTATSAVLGARAADRADAAHLALAELILRDDGAGSTVAVRVDDAPAESVLVRLLPLLAEAASPVQVTALDDAALSAATDDGAEDHQPDPALTDGSADEAALADLAPGVRDIAAAVDTFAGMVEGESARADELRLRVATSLAHGVEAEQRTELLRSVRDAVEGAFGSVSLAGQTDVNLTSESGTLPIVIRNDNPFPVAVVLRVRSDRLTFPDGDRFEVEVTEELTRLDIPVDARATGSVPTFVELVTPDEQRVLGTQRLDVRSTAVSGVGLAISLGALAVLVVWWVRTWRRSRVARSSGRHLQER